MRIAVISHNRRRVGGAETYLSNVIPAIARSGHAVSFWCELDQPDHLDRIPLPEDAPAWCVSELGAEAALAALAAWRPDVIFAHGLSDPNLEGETIKLAPAVFFAHGYYGTCISGSKTHALPTPRPCQRKFGLACMLHYYPRRCGGLNPITMATQFAT